MHEIVSNAVDQIIQEEPGWIGFFQAKAALQPHRAMDILKQYVFIKAMVNKWAGKRLPFKRFHAVIEPVS